MVAAAAAIAMAQAAPATAQDKVYERLSSTPAGLAGAGASTAPAVSADGTVTAFVSSASDLVPGDGNGRCDVFVRDTRAGTTERATVGPGGAESTGPWDWSPGYCGPPSISADGRMIAFATDADNLITGDVNRRVDVFVHDRATGITSAAGLTGAGELPAEGSHNPDISADGRVVAFQSRSADLLGRWMYAEQVLVRDLAGGTTELVSSLAGAEDCMCASSDPSLSGDGRFVGYVSAANDHVPGDDNWRLDVFVRDRETGTLERVTVRPDGSQSVEPRRYGFGFTVDLSDDGRFVAFDSDAEDLAPDGNGEEDVFVRDRRAGVTTLVSRGPDGDSLGGMAPSLSADGARVAFETSPGRYRPLVAVFDTATAAVGAITLSEQWDVSTSPAISGDGGRIAFASTTAGLAPGDANGTWDVLSTGPSARDGFDVTRPVLHLPERVVVPGTTWEGAVVTFDATARDSQDPNPPVVCSEQSGAVFVYGETTVNCYAEDAAGNWARGTFVVHVLHGGEQLQALREQIATEPTLRDGRRRPLLARVDAAYAAMYDGTENEGELCRELRTLTTLLEHGAPDVAEGVREDWVQAAARISRLAGCA